MIPFDTEAMDRQVAAAAAAREENERAYAETSVKPEEIGIRAGLVHAASILVWCRIAEIAQVPFIPCELIASLPMRTVEKFLDGRDDEMSEDEKCLLSKANAYCRSGGYWRTEICAPMHVKMGMAHDRALPDIIPLHLDDPRLWDMHYNMPDVKIISRPRLTPVRHADWPVEFRTFFGGQSADGAASWYYPQAGRFEVTDELQSHMDCALEMGRKLHETREALGLIPALPDMHGAGPHIGSTIDFMLTEEMGLVLVDAGPGAGYGAHPCCFIDVPVEGRRWHLAEGVRLR